MSLLKSEGPIAADLKENEFLSSIQQRSAIPGGTCDFDLPAYHYWLKQPTERRVKDLAGWLARFDTIAGAIQLVLSLIRDSAPPQPATAEGGFYQRSLDPNQPCQLVRVLVDNQIPCYAEISGGKHRFTIRFLAVTPKDGRAQQFSRDVSFGIACCTL
jgi:cell division protein ZapD